jgi:glycine cleavage system aminomethyltransferase T
MVDFGGWDMPVEYSGLIAEHMAVRTGVGVFDVSHMGDILIYGKQALDAVNHISMNDAARLQISQAHYSALLYPQGTFVDDVIVHKLGEKIGIGSGRMFPVLIAMQEMLAISIPSSRSRDRRRSMLCSD